MKITNTLATTLAVAAPLTSLAQQKGTQTTENHPSLNFQTCTVSGGCTTEKKSVTIDGNWRWTHGTSDTTNCYDGNSWDSTLCPDDVSCAKNCALEGADSEYTSTYGVEASGDDLTLGFVTQGPYSKNIGSRTYLLNSSSKYQMFNLKNKEFTFDVDVSNMPCGLNGALYFVEMPEDGGMSEYSGNNAGAALGTGYCDAQCPHDIKFINGEGNSEGWEPSDTDPNAGTGKYGSCCVEMDIWEANSQSQAYTPHSCDTEGQVRCEGTDCGDNGDDRYAGLCDKDGCDFAPNRAGIDTFFGMGGNYTVDSSKPMTVVTQFITSDGTDSGDLTEIRRLYVQDGEVINNPTITYDGVDYDSVTDDFCDAQKGAFGEETSFQKHGGLKVMGEAFDRGMVLVMSLWDDHYANMLWLDSDYPSDADPTDPGVHRGPCGTDSGVPDDVESDSPNSSVTFSSIKFGEIGSTYSGGTPTGDDDDSSGCPGGDLASCIGLCPSSPAEAYQACVNECVDRC